jgi:hypothetical protein
MRSLRRAMRTVSEIIESLGGTSAAATALTLPETTVSSWKSRGSIPPAYWSPLIAAARKRGASLDLELLHELAAPARRKGKSKRRAA